jgi:hypothetical protein
MAASSVRANPTTPSSNSPLPRAPSSKTRSASSTPANTRRAIDLKEGDKLNEAAFKALIKEAVTLNSAPKK